MNIVEGKIVERESYAPLPDLVVVAYDWDQPRVAQQLGLDQSHLQNLTTAFGADGDGPLRAPELMRFWDELQSDRLGSVLTGEDGTFRLEFEDDLFKRRDPQELRPDLILFVLAPEDTAKRSGPLSNHPLQRLLHFSYSIRAGAGRIESYMIRLPREALAKAGIPYGANRPRPEDRPQDPDVVAAALENQIKLTDALRAHATIATALAPHRTAALNEEKTARTFARKLVRASLSPRVAVDLVARAPEERLTLVNTAVDRRLTRLASLDRPFFVPLAPADARRFEEDTGLAAEDLTSRGALDLVRTRSVLDACRAKHLCRELGLAPPDEPAVEDERDDDDDSTEGPARPTVEEAAATVLDKVVGQIGGLPSGAEAEEEEDDPLFGLERRLNALRLRGGAADDVAFYDFHSLQIAFKSVWEQVYGDALEEDVSALYREWVRVREYTGEGAPSAETLNEISSLKSFLRRVESDLSAAAGLAERTGTFPDHTGTARPAGMPLPPGMQELFDMGGRREVAQRERSRRPVVQARAPGDPPAPRRDGASVTVVERGGGLRAAVGDPRPGAVRTRAPSDPNLLARVTRLMGGLSARLSEPYAFDVFAPNTCNFGLVVTHRQMWKPEAYQVGRLVSTLPLAPGEKRSFSVKRTVRTSRAQKEIENALSSMRGESSHTGRAEAEIVARAAMNTTFKQTARAEGSVAGLVTFGGTTELGLDQRQESEQKKRDFREAVRRSAEEFKKERTLEVTSEREQSDESVSSGEVSNPNNEITVTYLFYELQRRYRVSDQIHRVQPVVLVAQDVPAPEDIDEAWLVSHEWILRRVLLDDGLQRALDYLTESLAGDEMGVEVLRASWERNLLVVERLSAHLDDRSAQRDRMRDHLVKLLSRHERDETGRDVAAAIFSGGLSLLFGGGEGDTSLESVKEAASRDLEFADDDFVQAESRLRTAISALEASTDKYVAALRAQLNRRVAIDQLRVHVKENILHYMQAIWSHEPDDQRFFRLYNVEVPWIALEGGTVHEPIVRSVDPSEVPLPLAPEIFGRILGGSGPLPFIFEARPRMTRAAEMRPLIEVADLDRLLGFKGNYMIFPLKEHNPLTRFMMQDYRPDPLLGLLDPDPSGNVDVDELKALLECAKEDETVSDEDREALRQALCDRLVSARHDAETIIVPTGELYIEALPGARPVLEEFKVLHRAIDVRRAEADLRAVELDNLRRASRLIEGEREDPDVDKSVVIHGGAGVHVGTE